MGRKKVDCSRKRSCYFSLLFPPKGFRKNKNKTKTKRKRKPIVFPKSPCCPTSSFSLLHFARGDRHVLRVCFHHLQWYFFFCFFQIPQPKSCVFFHYHERYFFFFFLKTPLFRRRPSCFSSSGTSKDLCFEFKFKRRNPFLPAFPKAVFCPS